MSNKKNLKKNISGFILVISLFIGVISSDVFGQTDTSEKELFQYIDSLSQYRTVRHYKNIPSFSETDYTQALNGKQILYSQEDPDGEHDKIARLLRVVDIPVWKLWAAFTDRDHYEEFIENIKESINIETTASTLLTYNITDIHSRIISNRHQVLESSANKALWEVSKGRMWEYFWHVHPESQRLINQLLEKNQMDKVSKEDVKKAVLIKRNDSCWLLIPLPDDRTLMEAFSCNNPGGKIPKILVKLMSGGSAGDTLAVMEAWIHANYERHFDKDHKKLLSPVTGFVRPVDLRNFLPQF